MNSLMCQNLFKLVRKKLNGLLENKSKNTKYQCTVAKIQMSKMYIKDYSLW